jgi:hypothetical protein
LDGLFEDVEGVGLLFVGTPAFVGTGGGGGVGSPALGGVAGAGSPVVVAGAAPVVAGAESPVLVAGAAPVVVACAGSPVLVAGAALAGAEPPALFSGDLDECVECWKGRLEGGEGREVRGEGRGDDWGGV